VLGYILAIFSLVKVLFPPNLCDPFIQGGKNWGEKGALSSLVKNSGTHFREIVLVLLFVSLRWCLVTLISLQCQSICHAGRAS
jgi:hypothetical protein